MPFYLRYLIFDLLRYCATRMLLLPETGGMFPISISFIAYSITLFAAFSRAIVTVAGSGYPVVSFLFIAELDFYLTISLVDWETRSLDFLSN